VHAHHPVRSVFDWLVGGLVNEEGDWGIVWDCLYAPRMDLKGPGCSRSSLRLLVWGLTNKYIKTNNPYFLPFSPLSLVRYPPVSQAERETLSSGMGCGEASLCLFAGLFVCLSVCLCFFCIGYYHQRYA
jgi:hypothetical protein